MAKQEFNPRTASVQDIEKKITSIKGRAETMREDVQLAAVAALVQVQARNSTYLNQLWIAMGNGMRRDSLGVWIMTHVTGLRPNRGKDKATRPFLLGDAVSVDIDGAIAQKWYTAKKDTSTESVFNMMGRIENLLKAAQAAAKKGQLSAKDAQALHKLQQVLAGTAGVE